jgi:hypothetical protein
MLPALNTPNGATDSFVITAEQHSENRIALPIGLAFVGVVVSTTIRASL